MRNSIFKIEDDVYDFRYGWGVVIDIDEQDLVIVKFDCARVHFTADGRMTKYSLHPSLSFTEYNFVTGGFSQERLSKFAKAYNKVKRIINKSIPKK